MTQEFRFDYDPGAIRFGRGSAADLGDELAAHGLDRALVVCGRTVGETAAVMDPVRDGLGDRLAGAFAETTPAKTLGTALDAVRRARETDADALVAVGGGSSLDAAKVASALASHDDPESTAERAVETGDLAVAEDGDPLPIVAVPTTLAGADLSVLAGVTLTMDAGEAPDDAASGGVADRRLMPRALVYDPALVATTPPGVRCASAMNGFDKAVEAVYSPNATPVTDGTATRGLSLMRRGFEALPDEDPDPEKLSDAVAGVVLAQYGISTPGAYKLGVIHAFGHGLRDYGVHQGVAHAVVTPHVLRALFDAVDGRRRLLADGLGLDADGRTDDEVGEAVVDAVASVRDDLDLPARLRDLDAVERGDLGDVAENVAGDSLMDATPDGFDPTVEDIEAVLERAW